ncbi:MAG: cadmium-translocating P-type ATPase [Ignavibacteriales bacterium]|nr:MAG: cadmium-translocating P-type ATPase [Ignavibacteriales bacterium]
MEIKLKNLDCAACAHKIETRLNKIDNVRNISINTLTSVLKIDYDDFDRIKAAIAEVDDNIVVERIASFKSLKDDDDEKVRNEIIRIVLVLILFGCAILFESLRIFDAGSLVLIFLFISAYLVSGWTVLLKAIKNIFRGKIFDENFLMAIATIGAIAINELNEAVAVMLFYNIGEFLQGLSVRRSRNSIKSLLEFKPDSANQLINGEVIKVSPEAITIGSEIIVKPGEKIPLDGTVTEGESYLDTMPLTGESIPKFVKPGSTVLAGTINKSSLLKIKTIKLFSDTSVAKILHLAENAVSKKAEPEKFISKFARYYTPAVVAIATLIAFLPPLLYPFSETYSEWIYRALVILVISCPCALVISIPLGYFGGIGAASRRGILVKGSNYLDALTEVKTIVYDKTGTITKGRFDVTSVKPLNGFSENELLRYASIAESNSNHPIAVAIKDKSGITIQNSDIKNYEEVPGHGVKVESGDKIIVAGNDRILHKESIEHDKCELSETVVHIAMNNKYAGFISVSDEIKPDSADAFKQLKEAGIHEQIILTGDNEKSANLIASNVSADKVYSGLMPEEKVSHLEKIISEKKHSGKIAFVGDGINDAPVLSRADIGIAMGAYGSDAAIEAADVVIMTDSLSKIGEAIDVAKQTRKIVWQNIFFAMGVKAIFIAMGSAGIASMWEAVFADMGVALLAIINSTRLMRK